MEKLLKMPLSAWRTVLFGFTALQTMIETKLNSKGSGPATRTSAHQEHLDKYPTTNLIVVSQVHKLWIEDLAWFVPIQSKGKLT